jgi:hypothetical protein
LPVLSPPATSEPADVSSQAAVDSEDASSKP